MDLDERMTFLRRREKRVDPGHWRGGNNVARCLDVIAAGGPLVAIKVFSAGGKDYRPGDLFDYSEMAPARVSRLAEHGWIRPQADFNMAQAHKEIADFVAHQEPLFNTLEQQRREVPRAEALVRAAEQALQDARTRLSDAKVHQAHLEQELAAALAGPDIEEILSRVDKALS